MKKLLGIGAKVVIRAGFMAFGICLTLGGIAAANDGLNLIFHALTAA